jgi:hypothetical protein
VLVNSAGVVGQDFSVEPTRGFWMQTPSEADYSVKITFAGRILYDLFLKDVEVKDLTGNPFPISFPSSDLGVDGDIASIQSGTGLSPMIKSGGSWGEFTTVGLNQGFWYQYAAGDRRWRVEPASLQIKLEEYQR